MAFNVKPFKEMIALSKEKLDEAMAPIRARSAKAKADLEVAKIDEKMITLEGEIQRLCIEKDLNFDSIIDKMNEFALLERRKTQVTKLIEQLFPAE